MIGSAALAGSPKWAKAGGWQLGVFSFSGSLVLFIALDCGVLGSWTT
jgi:hypothetical protein